MAITTVDGALAGMQAPQVFHKVGVTMEAAGVRHSHWYSTGMPGAGVAPSPGVNGASVSSTTSGQIPHTDPGSGNAYLARFVVTPSVACTVMLCDRLWHNSGLSVTSTSPQAITPAALPSRDRDGGTSGHDVLAAIEWSAAGGAGTPTVTLTYTDQGGGTGATGTFTANATPTAGTFEIFTLAAGDTGVQAPTSFQQSGTRTSGTMHLILFRVLAMIPCPVANIAYDIDALTGGMPRLYNGTVPFLVQIPTATTATTLAGQYFETHG